MKFAQYQGRPMLYNTASAVEAFRAPAQTLPGAFYGGEHRVIVPEEYSSIKELLHRYGEFVVPTYQSLNPTALSHGPYANGLGDELSSFSRNFKYWRGGLRYKLLTEDAPLYASPVSLPYQTPTNWERGANGRMGWVPYNNMDPGLTIELPFYNDVAYVPVYGTNASKRGGTAYGEFVPSVIVSDKTKIKWITRAVAEDFQLFLMLPPLATSFGYVTLPPALTEDEKKPIQGLADRNRSAIKNALPPAEG